MECANGATGVFITTTDAPGTNRYEISGDRGKLVVEDNKITFWRLRRPEPEFNASNTQPFGAPRSLEVRCSREWRGAARDTLASRKTSAEHAIPPGHPTHRRLATEGINGLTLVNAMYLLTWLDTWVDIPFDENSLWHSSTQRRAPRERSQRMIHKVAAQLYTCRDLARTRLQRRAQSAQSTRLASRPSTRGRAATRPCKSPVFCVTTARSNRPGLHVSLDELTN
jgi:hypothetical protein